MNFFSQDRVKKVSAYVSPPNAFTLANLYKEFHQNPKKPLLPNHLLLEFLSQKEHRTKQEAWHNLLALKRAARNEKQILITNQQSITCLFLIVNQLIKILQKYIFVIYFYKKYKFTKI